MNTLKEFVEELCQIYAHLELTEDALEKFKLYQLSLEDLFERGAPILKLNEIQKPKKWYIQI